MSEAAERCYVAALRILNYRFNSEAELRRKLSRKQFDREAVDAAIEKLRGEGWIDDDRFAGALARTRSARSIGRRRIERELQAAGVDEETAGRAVSANLDPEQERERAAAAALKRARLLSRRYGSGWTEMADGRNKLTAYLLKQGYDAALVHDVVRQTCRAVRSSDADPSPD